MNDLIYRNQVIEAISKLPVKVDNLGYTWMIASDVLKQIDDIPSTEPEERTTKVRDKKDDPMVDEWHHGRCMNCGKQIRRKDNYCSRCGARLEWE